LRAAERAEARAVQLRREAAEAQQAADRQAAQYRSATKTKTS
jgi:hypothetical protein